MILKKDDSFENIVTSKSLHVIRKHMVYASNLSREDNEEVKSNCIPKDIKQAEQIRQFMVHYPME